jgi:hypothetical protein
MTLIFARDEILTPYLLANMSVAQWAATYRVPLPPIDILGLVVWWGRAGPLQKSPNTDCSCSTAERAY